MQERKKIIIAPLNWGLGHAARCIPIIKALLEKNYEVIIASDGGALLLLQKEFPELESVKLPAYNINYSGKFLTLSLILQSFKIFFAVVREYFFLKNFLKNFSKKNIQNENEKNILKKYFFKNKNEIINSDIHAAENEKKFSAIISDNRLGFFNRAAEKNIFITHQYNIKTPHRTLDFFINIFNRFFINQFDQCWIPDVESTPNLAGELSHGATVNKNKTRYIGALSRMKKFKTAKLYDIIAVLSGPEPQRTYLEKIILSEFNKYLENHPEKKLCLVRGVSNSCEQSAVSIHQGNNKSEAIQNTRVTFNPTFKNKSEAMQETRENINPVQNKSAAGQNTRGNESSKLKAQSSKLFDVFDFLTTDALNEKLMQSDILIARSGYSTIMDLAALQMSAILIPTPGQTEQEYLAQKFMSENIFFTVAQSDFDLERALFLSKNYSGFKENKFIYAELIDSTGL